MKNTVSIALMLCLLGAATLVADVARLRLATTTSTENSGLLSVLIPPFERFTELTVDVIAVGTGKALALGQNGDVDLVLVHARKAEDAFVAAGYGVNRRGVMRNDFVILGPVQDPAGIRGIQDAAEALKHIASRQTSFVSRGDNSGTHQKERELWTAARVTPRGTWYKEAGQGMGAVITIAHNMQAYTLADRGTYLAMRRTMALEVLVQGDSRLFNPYGVIAVNPYRHPHVNYDGAMRFIAWLTSPEGQRTIGDFMMEGQVLFIPDTSQ